MKWNESVTNILIWIFFLFDKKNFSHFSVVETFGIIHSKWWHRFLFFFCACYQFVRVVDVAKRLEQNEWKQMRGKRNASECCCCSRQRWKFSDDKIVWVCVNVECIYGKKYWRGGGVLGGVKCEMTEINVVISHSNANGSIRADLVYYVVQW